MQDSTASAVGIDVGGTRTRLSAAAAAWSAALTGEALPWGTHPDTVAVGGHARETRLPSTAARSRSAAGVRCPAARKVRRDWCATPRRSVRGPLARWAARDRGDPPDVLAGRPTAAYAVPEVPSPGAALESATDVRAEWGRHAPAVTDVPAEWRRHAPAMFAVAEDGSPLARPEPLRRRGRSSEAVF
ncbi:hypothetical protein G5C60_01225 [Streptomyces sp. HC44]|uniref:Uncharacterized protein n=1 Tax=Streptomyces scabichelini TaxID=2711217 RepID=A0A6G4UX37_9ACTN|nr:hypothetical protein [Streptomyces scabichelini]